MAMNPLHSNKNFSFDLSLFKDFLGIGTSDKILIPFTMYFLFGIAIYHTAFSPLYMTIIIEKLNFFLMYCLFLLAFFITNFSVRNLVLMVIGNLIGGYLAYLFEFHPPFYIYYGV